MDIFFRVVRRDGQIVEFDPERITKAIFEAAKSVGGEDIETAKRLTIQVQDYLVKNYSDRVKIDVEEIQDAVEKMLIEDGHYKTAKAYILYREHHTKVREINSAMIDVDKTINEYLRKY